MLPEDTMTRERYRELENNHSLSLTKEEVKQGYHFCYEWDGLLIHVTHPEFKACICKSMEKWKNENSH